MIWVEVWTPIPKEFKEFERERAEAGALLRLDSVQEAKCVIAVIRE